MDDSETHWSLQNHVRKVSGYTWNLKFRNNIGQVATKNLTLFVVISNTFIVFIEDDFIIFWAFCTKKGRKCFPKTSIFKYFVMSKMLKYNVLVVLSSFLHKFRCLLYFDLSSWDLVPKKLLRNLDLFIIALCNSFFIKGASFARRYFCLIGPYLSNILSIVSL